MSMDNMPTIKEILQVYTPKINSLEGKINNCTDKDMLIKYHSVLTSIFKQAILAITAQE
ncbi:MAG TPA: hypothetical protein PK431_15290 [Chitinophagales bacterium]|nr:hypothetical protein [Chitinophagales bacterium]